MDSIKFEELVVGFVRIMGDDEADEVDKLSIVRPDINGSF